MTKSIVYPLLSKYSLLRMLHHAIGKEGVLSNPSVERVKNFLSYDAKYNYPSIIYNEIMRAKKMNLLKIEGNIVSFTNDALALIEEYNIKDGVNDKFWKMREMEKEGKNNAANMLREQVNKEGFWWRPEEWEGREIDTVTRTTRQVKAKSITPSRKMAMPRKMN